VPQELRRLLPLEGRKIRWQIQSVKQEDKGEWIISSGRKAFRRTERNYLLRLTIVEQSKIGSLKSFYRPACLISDRGVETDESFCADRFTRKLLPLSELRISGASWARFVRTCD
jgi:hypothetical protein